MNLQVKYDSNQLRLIGQHFPKGSASGLNKMTQQARTQASSKIREKYNIQKQDLDKNFYIKQASPTNLTAVLGMKSRRLTVRRFLAKIPRPQKGIPVARREPVKVRITKGTTKIIRSGFYVAKFNQVFRRIGQKLQIIQTISPSHMFGSKDVQDHLDGFIKDKLPRIMRESVAFFGR